MEPFAYQQPKHSSSRKLAGVVIAGIGLTVWYLDLVPKLAPVATGTLNPALSEAEVTDADFIAMLSDPESADAAVSATPDADRTAPESVFGNDATAFDRDAGLPGFDEILDESAPQPAPVPNFDPPQPHNDHTQPPAFSQVTQASFEPSAVPPGATAVLSAEVAAKLRQVDTWIKTDETLEAHAAMSRLYWKEPEVRSHLIDRLAVTSADIYANPARHFAEPYVVQFGDTLEEIGRSHNVPWQYLARLNRVTPDTLQAGQPLKVLKGPFGAVVELDSLRLTLHAHGWYVRSYSIGLGPDAAAAAGEFQVQEKREQSDPASATQQYWVGLGNRLAIHSANNPNAIGTRVAVGSIHVAEGDIAEIYQLLGTASPVVIR